MSKKVTLQNVAKIAGVTVSTAHKALHGQKGVSEETRRKILEIASSLQYRLQDSHVQKSVHVAIVLPKPIHANKYFYKYLWRGIHDRLEQLPSGNFSVEEYVFEGSSAEQLVLLEKIYQERRSSLNALLTIVWEEAAYADLISRFSQDGVKVFTVSSDAPASQRVCSIMTNPCRSGRLAAEFLGPRLPHDGRVILLGTRRDTINHAQIVRGFCDEMLEINPSIEIIELYETVHYPEKLFQTLLELIHSFDNIRAIYANNARATAGICNVLNRSDIPSHIQIVGSEYFTESGAMLKNGRLCAIIDQNAYQQGFQSICTLFDHLVLEKEVSPVLEIYPSLLLKNSLPPSFL